MLGKRRNLSKVVSLNINPARRLLSAMQFASTVGKLLGVTKAAISAKMRGRKNFTKEQVAKLGKIFGKPAEYLLKRD